MQSLLCAALCKGERARARAAQFRPRDTITITIGQSQAKSSNGFGLINTNLRTRKQQRQRRRRRRRSQKDAAAKVTTPHSPVVFFATPPLQRRSRSPLSSAAAPLARCSPARLVARSLPASQALRPTRKRRSRATNQSSQCLVARQTHSMRCDASVALSAMHLHMQIGASQLAPRSQLLWSRAPKFVRILFT